MTGSLLEISHSFRNATICNVWHVFLSPLPCILYSFNHASTEVKKKALTDSKWHWIRPLLSPECLGRLSVVSELSSAASCLSKNCGIDGIWSAKPKK